MFRGWELDFFLSSGLSRNTRIGGPFEGFLFFFSCLGSLGFESVFLASAEESTEEELSSGW